MRRGLCRPKSQDGSDSGGSVLVIQIAEHPPSSKLRITHEDSGFNPSRTNFKAHIVKMFLTSGQLPFLLSIIYHSNHSLLAYSLSLVHDKGSTKG